MLKSRENTRPTHGRAEPMSGLPRCAKAGAKGTARKPASTEAAELAALRLKYEQQVAQHAAELQALRRELSDAREELREARVPPRAQPILNPRGGADARVCPRRTSQRRPARRQHLD